MDTNWLEETLPVALISLAVGVGKLKVTPGAAPGAYEPPVALIVTEDTVNPSTGVAVAVVPAAECALNDTVGALV